MSSQLIFITGITGFIGSATALEALRAGYNLRVCVRKPSQIEQVQSLFKDYEKQLEFSIVPDFQNEAAFDGKLDNVDYILHLASPLPRGTDPQAYFGPAVNGTVGILKAASKVATIKKVVITSSIAALIPVTGVPENGVIRENNDWNFKVDQNANFEDPQNPTGTPMRLYHASKLLANNASWDFIDTTNPHYSLVTIHPAFVYGHNLTQTTADGVIASSNGSFWKTLKTGIPFGNSTGVHVRDVAEAHVKALDPQIKHGLRYLLAGKGKSWKDIARIVNRDYPDAGFGITENIEGDPMKTDTTKAEVELGMRWRSMEEMVHEVVDQQLGFVN